MKGVRQKLTTRILGYLGYTYEVIVLTNQLNVSTKLIKIKKKKATSADGTAVEPVSIQRRCFFIKKSGRYGYLFCKVN
jgi:hypothetical protein